MAARRSLVFAGLGFLLLWLAVAGLTLYVSHRFRYESDWTASGRNSLAAPSRAVVKKLKGPVLIQAFAPPGAMRRAIRLLVGRYQRANRDVHLRFIDPNKHPEAARRNHVTYEGELRIVYRHRHATVVKPSESAITNTLFSLERTGLREIVFLTGNGERSPKTGAPYGLSSWAGQLRERGFQVRSLDLGTGRLPHAGKAIVVIADPRVRFLAGEVRLLVHYVRAGGNLVWLVEPNHVEGLGPLANTLGIHIPRGFLVDPASSLLTGHMPTFVTVSHYPAIGAVRGLNLITLFPTATALTLSGKGGLHPLPILRTDSAAWQQTAPVGHVIMPPAGVKPAPKVLGVALEKAHGKSGRVIVIGDSDFVSNAYLGQGGNLTLAMNMANWVASDSGFINIPNRTSADLTLNLTQTQLSFIAFGFMLVLPLLFVGNGVWVWWRRRRR